MIPDMTKRYKMFGCSRDIRVLWFDDKGVYLEFSDGLRAECSRAEFDREATELPPEPLKPRRVWVNIIANPLSEVGRASTAAGNAGRCHARSAC